MTTKTEATKTVKTAKKYTIKDLGEKLAINDSKKLRAAIRKLAAQNYESPRFRVVGKSYEWNSRDFASVVKSVERLLEQQAAACAADCQTSVSEECHCRCQGANHGIAV